MRPGSLTADTIRPHLPEGRIAWAVHAYYVLGSTNDVARRLADGGAPEGTIVVAETQTGGRGRRGRVWHSPEGGLWFSLVLRPHLPPERAGGITIVAAIAVAQAVREAASVDVRIKWPNDVYVGSRKLAGVLVESTGEGTLVVGIGLNVNVPEGDLPRDDECHATSLSSEARRTFDRAELLGRILGEFEPRYFAYRSPAHPGLVDEWRELSLIYGEEVVVTRGDARFEGTVFSLEDDGGIVLRLRDGRHEKVLPIGDVSLTLRTP
jgi:BirA family biotin operon repressor/biotin-[acetyl-CoA-carboxylase] ligase